MEESDVGTFDTAVRRVSGAFQMRWKAGQLEELTRTYFRCLKAWPIADVVEAGKVCIQTLKHFPKAAEWIEILEAHAATRRAAARTGPAVRPMTEDERASRAQADQRRYWDPPCGCPACVASDVASRPIRFVPTLVDGTEDRVSRPDRHDLDVVGHWAHGAELARWYAAKDACLAAWPRKFQRILQLVTREPGDEG